MMFFFKSEILKTWMSGTKETHAKKPSPRGWNAKPVRKPEIMTCIKGFKFKKKFNYLFYLDVVVR